MARRAAYALASFPAGRRPPQRSTLPVFGQIFISEVMQGAAAALHAALTRLGCYGTPSTCPDRVHAGRKSWRPSCNFPQLCACKELRATLQDVPDEAALKRAIAEWMRTQWPQRAAELMEGRAEALARCGLPPRPWRWLAMQ